VCHITRQASVNAHRVSLISTFWCQSKKST